MTIFMQRRTFLIGLAAVIASPEIAKYEQYTGPISTGLLNSALKYRRIKDIIFSSMPTGDEIKSPSFREEPVSFTAFRNNDAVMAFTINPRATFRWFSAPYCEIEIRDGDILRIEVEQSYAYTTINIISNIEPDVNKRPKIFNECFRWKNGIPQLDSTAALDLRDSSLLIEDRL